jgi:hypothetical protein
VGFGVATELERNHGRKGMGLVFANPRKYGGWSSIRVQQKAGGKVNGACAEEHRSACAPFGPS